MLIRCPETEPIFEAAHLEGRLVLICRRIVVSRESGARLGLANEAETVIAEMRELATQRFSKQASIFEMLRSMEDAVRTLAEMPPTFHEDNVCPGCGRPLATVSDSTKVCFPCLEQIIECRYRLRSKDGFQTLAI